VRPGGTGERVPGERAVVGDRIVGSEAEEAAEGGLVVVGDRIAGGAIAGDEIGGDVAGEDGGTWFSLAGMIFTSVASGVARRRLRPGGPLDKLLERRALPLPAAKIVRVPALLRPQQIGGRAIAHLVQRDRGLVRGVQGRIAAVGVGVGQPRGAGDLQHDIGQGAPQFRAEPAVQGLQPRGGLAAGVRAPGRSKKGHFSGGAA
jgi:hypothetical protein